MSCTRCGACCVAPDISSLGKPLGVRCAHLTEENLCAVYDDRPQICRDYAADWLCERIDAPTLDERVRKYLEVFGLEASVPGVHHVRRPSSLPIAGADGGGRFNRLNQLVPGRVARPR